MFSISAIWAGFTALQWVQTLWKYRIWIISGITALALTTTIGVLKWKLHSAEAANANAEVEIGRLTDSVVTLTEINRRNAVTMKIQHDLAVASQADADQAQARAAILDRSYTALIRSLDHAKDNPPLSADQRTYLLGVWCLGRGREQAPGCPGH